MMRKGIIGSFAQAGKSGRYASLKDAFADLRAVWKRVRRKPAAEEAVILHINPAAMYSTFH